MAKKSQQNLPLRLTMCGSCPFRPGSPYVNLAPDLAASALSQASRICHSTGSDNGINRRTGKPPHLCRGARDVQLEFMSRLGVIDAPTDAAWNRQRVAIGMQATVVVQFEIVCKKCGSRRWGKRLALGFEPIIARLYSV